MERLVQAAMSSIVRVRYVALCCCLSVEVRRVSHRHGTQRYRLAVSVRSRGFRRVVLGSSQVRLGSSGCEVLGASGKDGARNDLAVLDSQCRFRLEAVFHG